MSERKRGAKIWDAIPPRFRCDEGSTSYAWIGRRAVALILSNTTSPPEAAHVQSFYLTEPMRIGRRRPRLGPLSMRPRTAAVDASLFGDRARRFARPARGTERFLGRCGSIEAQPSLQGNLRRPDPE